MVYGGFRRQGKMDDNYFNENFAESKRKVTKLEDKTYFGHFGPFRGHNLRECNGSKFLGNIIQIKAFVFTNTFNLIRRKTEEQKGHYRHALSIFQIGQDLKKGSRSGIPAPFLRESCVPNVRPCSAKYGFLTQSLHPVYFGQIWDPGIPLLNRITVLHGERFYTACSVCCCVCQCIFVSCFNELIVFERNIFMFILFSSCKILNKPCPSQR